MRRSLTISALLLLLLVPVSQGSCHMCLGDVAQDCASLVPSDCAGSAGHLAGHMPGYVVEVAGQAADQACEDIDKLGC